MKLLLKSIRHARNLRAEFIRKSRLKKYLAAGRQPWTEGYHEYKWMKISEVLSDNALLDIFRNGNALPAGYGNGLDERIVEYPYVFSRLQKGRTRLLDAGSTFNFSDIVGHPLVAEKDLCIFTYFPESQNFSERRISYEFGDLRNLPFRDSWFNEVVCISTLEHIGMDNRMYGFSQDEKISDHSSAESYRVAVDEMLRVLKGGGRLLLTFPFGKRINYGFFQQFDSSMLQIILERLQPFGDSACTFFQYINGGWTITREDACRESESYNPHTGEGKGTDGAAHSRAICAVEFNKKQ